MKEKRLIYVEDLVNEHDLIFKHLKSVLPYNYFTENIIIVTVATVSKIVAIDYNKRIGAAISDSSRKIAFALETISNQNIFNFR